MNFDLLRIAAISPAAARHCCFQRSRIRMRPGEFQRLAGERVKGESCQRKIGVRNPAMSSLVLLVDK